MRLGNFELLWLGHAGFKLKGSLIIYIDPFQISEANSKDKADLILLTHGHHDHCSIEDLDKITKNNTLIVATADCQSKLMKLKNLVRMEIVEPGMNFSLGKLRFSTIPSYNINKPFHSKEEHFVGYVIKTENFVLYHAGDTDAIEEIQKVTGYKKPNVKFIALLPIGGRFTMCPEEAADLAFKIKPDLVIPIHYGSIVGDSSDAIYFKELCEEKKIKCEILKKS
jgi:L-ascorbate metabolism protein UlaG (beta-lactamase superfamily)